jgi:hypothetical protein
MGQRQEGDRPVDDAADRGHGAHGCRLRPRDGGHHLGQLLGLAVGRQHADELAVRDDDRAPGRPRRLEEDLERPIGRRLTGPALATGRQRDDRRQLALDAHARSHVALDADDPDRLAVRPIDP